MGNFDLVKLGNKYSTAACDFIYFMDPCIRDIEGVSYSKNLSKCHHIMDAFKNIYKTPPVTPNRYRSCWHCYDNGVRRRWYHVMPFSDDIITNDKLVVIVTAASSAIICWHKEMWEDSSNPPPPPLGDNSDYHPFARNLCIFFACDGATEHKNVHQYRSPS